MRLRFLLCNLFCGLPFHPRHLLAIGKSRKSSANTATLAGTQGLLLSPCFYRQIHPQLLNSPQNVCSALFVPTLQGSAALLSECLERANTQTHQQHSLAPEQLSLAFKEHAHLPRDHTPHPPPNAKSEPQGTARYHPLIAPSSLTRALLPDLPDPQSS